MKKQTKQLWTGTISHTAVNPISGAMLRGKVQEYAPNIIDSMVKNTFIRSLNAVMEDVKEVNATQLWDGIEISVTLTIKPKTNEHIQNSIQE